MEFSYLEAQVKDVFPQVSPKQILRQAKRIVRQLNSATNGKLDTKTAITEKLNHTMMLNINYETKTITSGDAEEVFTTAVAVADYMVILSGTTSNDGVYTLASRVDADNITVDEDMVEETGDIDNVTVIICSVDSDFSLSYNTAGSNYMLTLPDGFIKLAPNGVIVANEAWDQRTIDYILRNTSEEAYNINERDEIVFGASAFETDVDTLIRGYFGITVPTSSSASATIAIPDSWIEGFTAGVLANIATMKEYRDADAFKFNYGVFNNMMQAIINQESARFTMETSEQRYNYNDPSK